MHHPRHIRSGIVERPAEIGVCPQDRSADIKDRHELGRVDRPENRIVSLPDLVRTERGFGGDHAP
ncbi:hypothetical protein P0F65_04125 [Sphingomonas sp. I4]